MEAVDGEWSGHGEQQAEYRSAAPLHLLEALTGVIQARLFFCLLKKRKRERDRVRERESSRPFALLPVSARCQQPTKFGVVHMQRGANDFIIPAYFTLRDVNGGQNVEVFPWIF